MIFGFVGLIFGSAGGQTSENIIKLKKFDNCKGCFLERENLEGVNLEGVDLKGANLEKANLKETNLEFDDKKFYGLFVGKVDPVKEKIKGAKNLKKAKGAKQPPESDQRI